jgi:hypothetical protein
MWGLPKSRDLPMFSIGGIGKPWMNKGALGWFHNVWSSYWIFEYFCHCEHVYTIAKMPYNIQVTYACCIFIYFFVFFHRIEDDNYGKRASLAKKEGKTRINGQDS